MKTFLTYLLWITLVAGGAVKGQETCDNDECFMATVNGESFHFRDYVPLNAMLILHQAPMDGRSTDKRVIYITLSGTTYNADSGKFFDQAIQLELNYDPATPDQPKLSNIYMHFKSTVYGMVSDEDELHITRFVWEPDHKGFRIWADFECAMRSWGYPNDGKKDVHLDGALSNILVSIPPWLMASR
jgi:hypothetical protein